MSEPKFTPGPWIVCPDVGLQIPVASVAKEGLKRNVSHVAGIRNGEGAANAHLIAAAPDLYKALAHLEPYLDAIVCYASTIEEHPPNGFILETKAALAKARGER